MLSMAMKIFPRVRLFFVTSLMVLSMWLSRLVRSATLSFKIIHIFKDMDIINNNQTLYRLIIHVDFIDCLIKIYFEFFS